MDAAAMASLCALLAHGAVGQSLPTGLHCRVLRAPRTGIPTAQAPYSATRMTGPNMAAVATQLANRSARDGIARVVFAEAGNQGDSGLAGVVYTILNRLDDGRWGASVDDVLDAPHQFEPVMRAGGDWRNLHPVSEAQQARVDTIINLALEGRLPDLTNGARFFQNPRIVANRAEVGQVSPSLVNFGGSPASAVIGAHSFYVEAGRGGTRPSGVAPSPSARSERSDEALRSAGGAIFVSENVASAHGRSSAAKAPADDRISGPLAASEDASFTVTAPPRGAMFVITTRPGGEE